MVLKIEQDIDAQLRWLLILAHGGADAFDEPWRTSPATKTPGIFVSSLHQTKA
jgi:hypothetical protein